MNELWPKEQIKELLQKRNFKNKINFEVKGISPFWWLTHEKCRTFRKYPVKNISSC